MDKKEILQFEADDASKMGINGKQVFFTKRINGKTIRNKLENDKQEYGNTLQEKENIQNSEEMQKDEDLFIEFKNLHYNEENSSKTKKTNNKINNNKKKINKKKKTKAQKRRKKRKRTLRIAMLLLIIIGIIAFAVLSPIFNINRIDVKGNEKIDTETIVSLSGLQEGNNIFRINKKNVTNSIKENTYINKAEVKRILPSTIEIEVEERKVAYQVKVINSYVYIDYQGYILEVSSKSANVPLVEGFLTEQDILLNGKRLSNNDLQELNAMLKIMEVAKSNEIANKISKITIKNNEYILEIKKEKKEIYLGSATDLTNKITYVKLILEKEKGNEGKIFVNGNLNNGFKPYFREK